MEDDKLHENCLRFPIDFDSGKSLPIHCGRLYLGGGNQITQTSCVRLYFTAVGLVMGIPKSAIDKGLIQIWDDVEHEILAP